MQEKLAQYAQLVIHTGINLKAGQTLVVNAPIECAPFARLIAQTAYDAGARDVVVSWNDEKLSKIRFLSAPEEIFDTFPAWRQKLYLDYAREGAAFVSIAASDPELLKDADPGRVARAQKASGAALKEYRERLMSNRNPWCVVSVPTEGWARKVFPDKAADAAVAALWQAIFHTMRIESKDAVAAWQAHLAALEKRKDFLNRCRFRYLRYRNAAGTDFTVELPEGHIWLSGAEYAEDGRPFVANMPTEEVFTMPKRTGANGTVVSAKPLNYNGSLIEDFTLTFKEGKVVKYSAKKGEAVLKKLLEADEGAAYLGEVALVPYDSPISNLQFLFYNTLFDENASCHLALGKAYPTCIEGGGAMSKEERDAAGVNESFVHEDFMIGTADLSIIGVTQDGKEVPVFTDGNFADF